LEWEVLLAKQKDVHTIKEEKKNISTGMEKRGGMLVCFLMVELLYLGVLVRISLK
jgi:hypothetical protein